MFKIKCDQFKQPLPIPDYVNEMTREERPDSIEEVNATVSNAADALGRLVEVLTQKGYLSSTEIVYVARGGVDPSAQLLWDESKR